MIGLLEKKHLRCAKKPKKSYEASQKFQDSWAVKLPWAKIVVGVNGKYEGVKCQFVVMFGGLIKFWSQNGIH
jgi:hypothetical protein